MKSILIAVAVMIAGLSTGCAEMEQLAKQYNPDNAKFPGLRPAETTESRNAQKQQRADEDAKRYAEQVKDMQNAEDIQAEREKIINASINRVRKAAGYTTVYPTDTGMTDEERKFEQWADPERSKPTIAEVKDAIKVREMKLIPLAKAEAKEQKLWQKAEEAKRANQQAEYEWIVKKQNAEYAAKVKADAARLEAARIERRDHPEIGAARDRARDKARREQLQAEEDVYRANHGGRSKTDDDMAVLEKDANRYLLERKLQQSLRGY